jgi:hypothetical protein
MMRAFLLNTSLGFLMQLRGKISLVAYVCNLGETSQGLRNRFEFITIDVIL